MVFSKLLYDNGFYDSMDIGEVKERENLLKSITAGMDSVGRNTYNSLNFFHDMDNANSYNGKPIYMTSTEARKDIKYYLQMAGMEHTEDEKAKFQLTINELFKNFRLGNGNQNTLFDQMKKSFADFATKNTDDKGLREYVLKQSEETFNRIGKYWSMLTA